MNFDLDEQQQQRYQQAVAFAEQNLNGDIAARDRNGEFDYALWKASASYGFLGLQVPASFGGMALSSVSAAAVMQGLGFGCRDNGLTFAINAQAWSVVDALLRFGTEQQQAHYLPPILAGDRIGCFAMTEAQSGSDCFALQATAEPSGNGFRINADKQLITFAPIADFAIVFANEDPSAGRWGVSAFIVEADTPGYQACAPQAKMGLRTVPIGQIQLSDCEVTAAQRLGRKGAGASVFNTTQETERSFILAPQVGAMERQLDEVIAFARERKQFGQSIGRFQSVSNRITEMKLRLETSRLLLYQTAWLRDQDRPNMLEAALTNIHLAETFVDSSLDAIRIRGGRGYLTEYEVERDARDAVGATLYGGTTDIQRVIVARMLGL